MTQKALTLITDRIDWNAGSSDYSSYMHVHCKGVSARDTTDFDISDSAHILQNEKKNEFQAFEKEHTHPCLHKPHNFQDAFDEQWPVFY